MHAVPNYQLERVFPGRAAILILATLGVEGSNPFARSSKINKLCRQSPRIQGIAINSSIAASA
jgi:hypothetical protein